ncbi:hypothetical protein GCM10009839_20320 [Catenulispora yoronensis]|uniref:Uncharacterized protein n=1 Tax=Catenulispora yoronensis TaxID=450799 RepID=A0ABP5FB86_9ACTN
MPTLAEAIELHGIDVDEHLDRQMTIPILSGLQAQGDVMVVPRPARTPAVRGVPSDGVAVVRGEFGGHTHTLLAEGDVTFDAEPEEGLDIGVLTVAEGATAYLAHPEHAYSGIGPGTYVLRRQRELDTTRLDAEELVARAAAARRAQVAAEVEINRVRYVRD